MPPRSPERSDIRAGARVVPDIAALIRATGPPPSRAMTTECAFTISRRMASELCIKFPPSPIGGRREDRGKTGCTPHPRSRVPMQMAKVHTSIQVRRKHPGLPCAMALRLTSRSSRRTALLPPSPALLIASLAPAPRRPNHATSPYAPVFAKRLRRVWYRSAEALAKADPARASRAPSASTASHRAFVTCATPLSSGETGRLKPLICPTTKAEYFWQEVWTGFG